MKTIQCYCGGMATLKSNAEIYGREYGNGRAWVCENFAVCRGSVGTHPNGGALGTIPDPETKKLRMEVHAAIDPIWKSKKYSRGHMYRRIAEVLGVPIFHVGTSTATQCREVLKLVPIIFAEKIETHLLEPLKPKE